MLIGGNYYALTLGAHGAGTPAYFSLTPTSSLQISQGGASITPSSPSSETVMVSIYPQTLQISAPAGTTSAGVTIVTNESRIEGRVQVSPPINVATVITLYGNGGQQIGQSIIDPGVSGGTFSFAVDAAESIPHGQVQAVIEQKIGTART